MAVGGDAVDPLCAACGWQVDTDSDMGGSAAEWGLADYPDDADPLNLTTLLGTSEVIADASLYLAAYTDPTLTQCVMGVAVAIIAGGASGFTPGNKTIRIRHIPPLRHIRLKRIS